MIEALKKAMLAGLGAAVITKEKAEEALSDWVNQGKVTTDEAKEMAARLAAQGRVEFEGAAQDLQRIVRDLLDQAGVGQKDKLEALERRLLAVEIEIANLATRARNQPPQ